MAIVTILGKPTMPCKFRYYRTMCSALFATQTLSNLILFLSNTHLRVSLSTLAGIKNLKFNYTHVHVYFGQRQKVDYRIYSIKCCGLADGLLLSRGCYIYMGRYSRERIYPNRNCRLNVHFPLARLQSWCFSDCSTPSAFSQSSRSDTKY